jgi:hypothetical protein
LDIQDDSIDKLWASEVESRIDAYEAGKLAGKPIAPNMLYTDIVPDFTSAWLTVIFCYIDNIQSVNIVLTVLLLGATI